MHSPSHAQARLEAPARVTAGAARAVDERYRHGRKPWSAPCDRRSSTAVSDPADVPEGARCPADCGAQPSCGKCDVLGRPERSGHVAEGPQVGLARPSLLACRLWQGGRSRVGGARCAGAGGPGRAGRLTSWRRSPALPCEELGIPELAGEVQSRVQHALTARRVAEAGASGRYGARSTSSHATASATSRATSTCWSRRTTELFVVDYKTDRVSGDAEVTAKAEHYGPQLRAYADALRRVPGVEVAGAALLLVSPGEAVDVEVDLNDRPVVPDGGPIAP